MAQQQQRPNQAPSVTHWRKVHKRKNVHLLFAEDLGPVGTSVDVEVVDSGVVTVEGADDSKPMPWLGFRGKDGKPREKRLALNVTNCKAMQSLAGSSAIEQWRGWITLLVVETTYYDQATKKKETTDAIRIAPKRPRVDTRNVQSAAPSTGQPEPAVTAATPPPDDEERRAIQALEREEANR